MLISTVSVFAGFGVLEGKDFHYQYETSPYRYGLGPLFRSLRTNW